MNDVLRETEKRMVGAVEAFKGELAKLRTGRASLAIIDGIMVDYYGAQTPLNQVATLSVPDPSTIAIAPWEPKVLAEIEKALLRSNLGLTPNNDGRTIRLNIPALTEERRKELVKLCRHYAEEARVAVRNIRRDANHKLDRAQKDSEISEDEARRAETEIQKTTDEHVKQIDEALQRKEAEIMEV